MSNYKVDKRVVGLIPSSIKGDDREFALAALRYLEIMRSSAQRAGEALCVMSDGAREILFKSMPSHIAGLLRNCYRVGLGEMHPKLATASGRGAQALKKLSYMEQDEFIANRIPVSVGYSNKKMMDFEEMTPEQVTQVFAQGGKHARVRSIDEQRRWLREQADKRKKAQEKLEHTEINRPNRWAIRQGKVYLASKKVQAGLTANDIEQIRKDLKL